jgi:hypothetical protein
MHLLPQIYYPSQYTTYKFVFSLHSTLLYFMLPLANCSRGQPSPGWSCHATTSACCSHPQASRATTPAGCNLPRNAAAVPWPQPAAASHSTQRLRLGRATTPARCAKAVAVPGRPRQATTTQQPPSKLNGKNQKIIWPNMGSDPTPLGRIKSISTTRPPPLMWYVVLFKFTYNCQFVNNVCSVALSKLF